MKKMKNIAGSRLPAGQAGKLEEGKSCFLTCNSNFPAPLSSFIKGDESRFIGTGGPKVKAPGTRRKENKKYRISLPGLLTGNDECRMMNNESGRNIPVRCTSGINAFSSATNISGATHLGFQTANAAFSGIAAAPRNLCSSKDCHSEKKVQRTETLKENKEYRISLPGLLTGNDECRMMNDESGRNILHWSPYGQYPILSEGVLRDNNQYSTTTTTTTTITTTSKYKANPLLPRGRFYSGDCPGAAAITIFYSLFSSSRVSPNWVAEFSTPHSTQCGVTPEEECLWQNSASRSAQPGLPVINQTLHQGSFVPLEKGDEIRPLVAGSEGVKERRYAYVLN